MCPSFEGLVSRMLATFSSRMCLNLGHSVPRRSLKYLREADMRGEMRGKR